jgi:hypothetical protein
MKRVANFGDRLSFRRKVAVTRAADELTATTNRKNDLGEIGRE